jgi:hypothetical protein
MPFDLKENEDPMCRKSSAETELPHLVIPYTLRALPSLPNILKLQEDPAAT